MTNEQKPGPLSPRALRFLTWYAAVTQRLQAEGKLPKPTDQPAVDLPATAAVDGGPK